MTVAVGGTRLETGTDPLVERALEGDDTAWAALYDALAPDVQRFLLGLGVLGRSEVEDCVQETFVRLVRDLPRFDRSRALRPFALGVARHVAIDAMRRRRAGDARLERVATAAPRAAEAVGEVAERREQATQVQAALGAVEPELRTLLVLRHTDRLTMQELAEAAACSVPTARDRLRRAARRFAVELRQRGVLPPGWVEGQEVTA